MTHRTWSPWGSSQLLIFLLSARTCTWVALRLFVLRVSGSSPCDQDHVGLDINWLVNSNNTLDNLVRNSTFAAQALAQWQIDGTGQLGLSDVSQFGWLRVPQATDFFHSFGISDPSAGLTSAHFELIPFVSFNVSISFIIWLSGCFSPEWIPFECCPVTCRGPLLLNHRRGHFADCS